MSGNLAIRIDASSSIGSGHAMRCSSIATEAKRRGWSVAFFVSDNESAEFLHSMCEKAIVLGGDARSLDFEDGVKLCDACGGAFDALIVDTYGATNGFFDGLARAECRICLVDDMYTFAFGYQDVPLARNVDIVLNYEFFADRRKYDAAYRNRNTKLLVGPSYAPLREEFSRMSRKPAKGGLRILVTSGATNPDGVLERMVRACAIALPEARLSVVVGAMADFDEDCLTRIEARLYQGVNDMAALMADSDMAVSAAGSTLYELCCTGVPTIALPIVENQVANAKGFVRWGLGFAKDSVAWHEEDLVVMLSALARNEEERNLIATRASCIVDGFGARRICDELL